MNIKDKCDKYPPATAILDSYSATLPVSFQFTDIAHRGLKFKTTEKKY